MKSVFGTINWQDLLKGLVVAVISAVLAVVYTTVQAGSLNFDWKVIISTAIMAALAYLSKNLLSNSADQVGKTEASVLQNTKDVAPNGVTTTTIVTK